MNVDLPSDLPTDLFAEVSSFGQSSVLLKFLWCDYSQEIFAGLRISFTGFAAFSPQIKLSFN
jgi:hypothetical protein